MEEGLLVTSPLQQPDPHCNTLYCIVLCVCVCALTPACGQPLCNQPLLSQPLLPFSLCVVEEQVGR